MRHIMSEVRPKGCSTCLFQFPLWILTLPLWLLLLLLSCSCLLLILLPVPLASTQLQRAASMNGCILPSNKAIPSISPEQCARRGQTTGKLRLRVPAVLFLQQDHVCSSENIMPVHDCPRRLSQLCISVESTYVEQEREREGSGQDSRA